MKSKKDVKDLATDTVKIFEQMAEANLGTPSAMQSKGVPLGPQ